MEGHDAHSQRWLSLFFWFFVFFELCFGVSIRAQQTIGLSDSVGELKTRAESGDLGHGEIEKLKTVAPATVSVSELNVPQAAKKELARFQQSLKSGNMRECVRHLTKAIHIYTQIAAAHQNLAACYVRLNEYEKAVLEFQTASEMDKHMIQPALGLAGTYLVLGRYGEAESASRRAVEINPEDSMARYLLGLALAFAGRGTAEAEELLRVSTAHYPNAHLALAGIFLKRNAQEEALTELRAYVQQPEVPPKYKKTIGCAIDKLSGGPQNISCTIDSPCRCGRCSITCGKSSCVEP